MTIQVRKTIPYCVYSTDEQELIDTIKAKIPNTNPTLHKIGNTYSWLILKEQIPLFE